MSGGVLKVKRLPKKWLGGLSKILVSSPYGRRWGRMHNGIDLAVPVGTQVLAPEDGTLYCKFQEGWAPGNGRREKPGAGLYAMLVCGNVAYLFMHLNSCVVGKNSSRSVSAGQPIGTTGGRRGDKNAGSSRGPHLHFEVRVSNSGQFSRIGAQCYTLDPKNVISDTLVDSRKGRLLKKETYGIIDVGQKYSDEQLKELKKGATLEFTYTDSTIMAADSEDVTSLSQDDYDDSSEPSEAEEYEVSDGYASGIWQIVKMVMDSDVANFLNYDPSLASMQGGLFNFVNRICQRPFVEFAGDTYGDMYYFTVRRPPFDREHMLAALAELNLLGNNKKYIELQEQYNALSESEQNSPEAHMIWNQLREMKNKYVINSKDVINSTIDWNNGEIYSWYQLYVMYEIGAQDDLKYITPAILFPEYAALYGSRDLTVQSPYISFINAGTQDALKKTGRSDSADNRIRSSIKELKYIIESNAYNPFTRSGSVTIVGNRKIKRGTFVSLNLEGVEEIFYVEGVSQDYSINNGSVSRTTTLQLSHGMVKSYIIGVGDGANQGAVVNDWKGQRVGTHKLISYFDIIDFGDIKKDLNFDNWKDGVSTWKVNRDVFNFFLKRLQMITPDYY